MANLTPDAIALLVKAEGFADPVTAVAVVLGESGGNPRATHTNSNRTVDRGLWQINSGAHPQVSADQAFDVLYSTRYAKSISNGGRNFGLWNATRQPTFAGHLETARKAVAQTGQQSGGLGGISAGDVGKVYVGGVIGGPVLTWAGDKLLPGNPLNGLSDALGGLAALGIKLLGVLLDRDFWTRLGIGLLGLALVLGGVALIKPDLAAAALGPEGMAVAKGLGA